MQHQTDVHKIFAVYFKGTETLAWALSKKLSEGNICLSIEEYKDELPGILAEQRAKQTYKEEEAIFWADPPDFENQCREGLYVTHSSAVLKPFVVLDGRAYLHRYFQYETRIIDHIQRLGNNFRIITGGPGTGKTYGVANILAGLYNENPKLKVALAAPTGKAAARMNESIQGFARDTSVIADEEVSSWLTGLKAQTLHRLLGYIPDSVFFRHNKENPLPHDVLIIDECSMVDVALMAKLLDAVSGHTRIYLLGDKDQLASVEAGSVFGDLCRAGDSSLLQGKVETKTKSYRFDPEKGIGRLSREVIAGNAIDFEAFANDAQVRIDTGFSNDLFEEYAGRYLDYLNEPDVKTALQKFNQVRFLCVTRENEHSVAEVNRRIERFLAGKNQDFEPRSSGFYHNQPVIITQNDYNLQVFNGDVGLIRQEGNAFYCWFEGPEGGVKKVQAGYLNFYETVFAMTIHKSQGSEFEHVVVILPDQHGEKLLTRELLYTAVTRAKSSVLVQTAKGSLDKCTGRAVSRASGIEKRLKS
jgi:exodeoxyribonuclease V alpha subunit